MRTFTVRWWHWIAVIVGSLLFLFAATLVTVRLLGQRELARVHDEIKAAGLIATYEEWLAATPMPPDPEAARQLRAVLRGFTTTTMSDLLGKHEVWLRSSSTVAPASLVAELASKGAPFERFLSMMRASTASLSARAELTADREQAAARINSADFTLFLMNTREVINYLALKAAITDDPTQPLIDMLRLNALQKDDGSIIGMMISVALSSITNQAYMQCVIKGRLSAQMMQRFIDQPPQFFVRAENAFMEERILFGLVLEYLDWNAINGAHGDSVGDLLRSVWHWSVSPGERATIARYNMEYELCVRAGRSSMSVAGRSSASWIDSWLHPVSSIAIPNLDHTHDVVTSSDASWRMHAALLSIAMAHRVTPIRDATAAALVAAPFLQSATRQIPLGVEMPLPGVVRVAMDPTAPWPVWVDMKRFDTGKMLGGRSATRSSDRERIELVLP